MTDQVLPKLDDRIRLIEMPDDPAPIEPGSLGTVTWVSPLGQIGVRRDSGRTLMLIAGKDKFEVVTRHTVRLNANNGYALYVVQVEASDPDQAAGIARELVDGDNATPVSQERREDTFSFVTDVIDAEGEECFFEEEHGYEGVLTPGLLATRNAAYSAVSQIDDFDVECESTGHTDTGVAWDLLRRLRDSLHAVLPEDLRLDLNQRIAVERIGRSHQ